MIDDIRGRIKPQYRVKDRSGKIWFVSALNIDILYDQNNVVEIDEESHSYRGGVRHDGTRHSNYRYKLPSKTTEEELKEAKSKKNNKEGEYL